MSICLTTHFLALLEHLRSAKPEITNRSRCSSLWLRGPFSSQGDATAESAPGTLHVPINRFKRQLCGLPCSRSVSSRVRHLPMQRAMFQENVQRLPIPGCFQRINDFLDSLLFHRKITAVPFTPVRGYRKQPIWARRSNDMPFGRSRTWWVSVRYAD